MELAMRDDVTLRDEYLLKVWDNYIADSIVAATPCRVAIYDLRSCRVIVASDSFYILDREVAHIAQAVRYPELAYRNGVTIREQHYEVQLADGRHGIYAKDGEAGCTVCKTFGLLIVGVHDKRVASERCNEQIMTLGDYFLKLGL